MLLNKLCITYDVAQCALLLNILCCSIYYVAQYTMLLNILCIMYYVAQYTMYNILCCSIFYVAQYTMLLNILCGSVYYVGQCTMLLNILCCSIYYVAQYTMLGNILCCSVVTPPATGDTKSTNTLLTVQACIPTIASASTTSACVSLEEGTNALLIYESTSTIMLFMEDYKLSRHVLCRYMCLSCRRSDSRAYGACMQVRMCNSASRSYYFFLLGVHCCCPPDSRVFVFCLYLCVGCCS
jgi:hypothetical protein